MSRDEPSTRHSPVACIHGRVRRKMTPGQSPGPRPPPVHGKSIARLWVIAALISPLFGNFQNAAKPAIVHGVDHLTKLWGPILNEGGIDLAICGHYHRLFKFAPEPGKNAFPVIGAPQDALIRADVTAASIDLKIIDIKGTTLESLTVSAKRK